MLQLFKDFSMIYAGGVTALAALGALLLSCWTLYLVKKEFFAKYRPYIVPVIDIKKSGANINAIIIPRNVGPHPCWIKLTNIQLHIGDENHSTPDTKEWMLLGTSGADIIMPAGYVNETGIKKIKNNNYRKNRVELIFTLHTKSIHDTYLNEEEYLYEIDLLSDEPIALFRPEWHSNKLKEKA